MAEDFQVGEHTYRAGRLDARTQFHVVRRLATVVSAFGAVLPFLKASAPIAVVEPLLKAIGEMKEEDADYVITKCLAVVQRVTPQGAFPIETGNGRLTYEDIAMPEMVQIVWHVLESNLKSFSSAFPFAAMERDPAQAVATGSPSPMTKTGSSGRPSKAPAASKA
jgi:hypothetical protein